MPADEETPLVEESTAAIISRAGAAAVARSACFLLPRAGATAAALPGCAPCAGPVLGDGHRVEFCGWPCSSALWRRWVERLRPRHEPLWREVGILDAVLATAAACPVRRDGWLVLQLAAFWCGATSSFAFPWGEATVTLEDAAVLGGLPLLGAPVTARLPGTLAGDDAALEAVRAALHRSKCKNSTYSTWLHHFLGRDGGDGDGEDTEAEAQSLLEHGAFLATWLSLYVLPAPPFKAVRPQVFPLAARPERGARARRARQHLQRPHRAQVPPRLQHQVAPPVRGLGAAARRPALGLGALPGATPQQGGDLCSRHRRRPWRATAMGCPVAQRANGAPASAHPRGAHVTNGV